MLLWVDGQPVWPCERSSRVRKRPGRMGRSCRPREEAMCGRRLLTDARVHTLIRPVSSAWGAGSGKTRDGPGPRSAPSERRATGIFVPVGRRHDGCANEYILRRWGNYSQSSKLLGVRRATAQAACAGFCRLAWRTTNQHGRGERERSRGAGGSWLTREWNKTESSRRC